MSTMPNVAPPGPRSFFQTFHAVPRAPSASSLVAWLYRIAMLLCQERQKRRRHENRTNVRRGRHSRACVDCNPRTLSEGVLAHKPSRAERMGSHHGRLIRRQKPLEFVSSSPLPYLDEWLRLEASLVVLGQLPSTGASWTSSLHINTERLICTQTRLTNTTHPSAPRRQSNSERMAG